MLADVHGYRHQLLRVGADNLLHDGGEIVVLRLPDDVEQLQRDLSDLRLQILAGGLALAGQHHLDGDGRLHLERKKQIVIFLLLLDAAKTLSLTKHNNWLTEWDSRHLVVKKG